MFMTAFNPDLAAINIITLLRWALIIAVGIVFIRLLFKSIWVAFAALLLGIMAYTLYDPTTLGQTGQDIIEYIKTGGGAQVIENIPPVTDGTTQPPAN